MSLDTKSFLTAAGSTIYEAHYVLRFDTNVIDQNRAAITGPQESAWD